MSRASVSAVAPLAGIVGASNCSSDPAELARYEVDGMRPGAVVRPGAAEEVAEVVRLAAAERLGLIACGGRSKLGIGMPPVRYDIAVDMTRMNRVVAYDPGDLTLSVEAGIRISELFDALAAHHQWLPMYVPWFDRATIGGILSSNSISPLRYMFGGPRDFILGMEFVTGDGKLCKSGTRVVKSVAGYDLHKLLLGALGSLGIITKVNFRTFPQPRAQRCFVVTCRDASTALDLCRRIALSPLKPAVLEVLDPGAARIVADERLPADSWCVVAAAIGHEAVVERHARDLARLAEQSSALSFAALDDADKQRLLGRVREFLRLVVEQQPNAVVLRTGLLPESVVSICETHAHAAAQNGLQCAIVLRAGATLYTVLKPASADSAPRLEKAVESVLSRTSSAACTTIERCPAALKSHLSVWGPARKDFSLMKRIKQVFDPHAILSPGRFVGGL
ncbi:MAG: FAD-binding oxidoreductase [Candidatus Acidiferrales bacterium]